MLDEHETAEPGAHTEPGRIREVVYVGMVTRYIVDLDEGGSLMVVRQNLETTSSEALEARGRRVRLAWRPEHTYVIEPGEEEESRMSRAWKRRLGDVGSRGLRGLPRLRGRRLRRRRRRQAEAAARADRGPRQRPRRDQAEGARGGRGQPRPVGRLRPADEGVQAADRVHGQDEGRRDLGRHDLADLDRASTTASPRPETRASA